MTIKIGLKKIVSLVLLTAILTPSVLFFGIPTARAQDEAAAVPVQDTKVRVGTWLHKALTAIGVPAEVENTIITNYDWALKILKEAAMAAAMKALQEVTKSTINWINSGYHGMPLFLENPDSFFKDIEKFEVRTLVDLYGYDELKYPYGKEFALNTIYAYKGTLANNSAYSLSNYIQDPVLLKNYQNDFNTGGWNGFLINTQFPQNNYIGFQMLANEELAGRIHGETGTAKNKVQDLLDQGMGFLSPQICQTNESYNDLKNEFNAPVWNPAKWEADYMASNPVPGAPGSGNDNPTDAEIEAWETEYRRALDAAEKAWHSAENPDYCPPHGDGSSGLVNTTPGSVVANQIIKSVQTPSTLKEHAINSGTLILSAVFDQLLNKFVDKGLNSLASAINPDGPQEDEWSYNGLTLGGSATVGGYGDPWDSGPDEVVTKSDLKIMLENDIAKTEAEIKYMTNSVPDSFGPGTMQALAQIWPKVQELDACQPGPDIKWQERLDDQMYANESKLLVPGYDGAGGEKQELEYASGVFKDWMDIQLKNALPSSSSFMSTINNLPDLSQQAIQVGRKIDAKESTLTQLRIMKARLDTLPEDPAAGSDDEKTLLTLWTQRKAIAGEIASDITAGAARGERDAALAKRDNLDQLIIECKEERAAKGWEALGGAQSKLASPAATEQVYFCEWPVVGGFSHKMFVNPSEPTHPQIPLVNATIQIGTSSVDIKMNCGVIFNASVLDYKGDLPSF